MQKRKYPKTLSPESTIKALGVNDTTGSAQTPGSAYVFTDTILVSLGAKDFAAVSKSKPNMPVFDLVRFAEYNRGHVWRSTHFDAADPGFAAKLAKLDRTSEYAVYCKDGFKSLEVAEAMKKMELKRIYHLQKGLFSWGSVRRCSSNKYPLFSFEYIFYSPQYVFF